MIRLKREDVERIIAHSRENLPEEACGLLGGTIDPETGVKTVEEVYLLENIDHTNEHFTISPEDQFKTLKDIRAKGLQPLGNWHSHPETPSRQSEEDKRLSYDSTASYLILSLQYRDAPVLKSFNISENQTVSTEEELVILD
ncbi:MAG: M67 family metallopeptidase [Clostridia bacterium]|nr:M67 family metallopeptidase [Clostridia bacterium]